MVGRRLKRGWLRFAVALLAICWLSGGARTIRSEAATVRLTISGQLDYTKSKEILALVNEYRQQNGVAPLVMNQTLQQDAMRRAQELAIYYSHTRPNKSDWKTALRSPGGYCGENIAMAYLTPKDVMSAWINSQGHRENILRPEYKQIGIGCYCNNGTWYWSQEFTDRAESSDLPDGTQNVRCEIEADTSLLDLQMMASSDTLQEGKQMRIILANRNTDEKCKNLNFITQIWPANCTWSTMDSSVAAVDASGNVTAKKAGVVGIVVNMGGVTKTGYLTVNHIAGPAATCTANQTCTYCGAVLAKATGHTPGPAATCTADQVCTKCWAVLVPKLGHVPGAEATCTTDQTCTRCGKVVRAALGHSEGPEATCTTDQTCTRCGKVIHGRLNHSYYIAGKVSPTATSQGYTLYRCSRCGDSYKTDIVPATGSVSKPSSGGSSSGGSSSGSSSSGSSSSGGTSSGSSTSQASPKGWMRAATTNSIMVTWRADSRAESGYAVAVKYGSKYLIVDIVGKNTRTYTLRKLNGRALTAGTTYVFWILPAVKYGNTYRVYTSNKTVFTATTRPATAAFTSVVRRAGTYAALRWRKVAGAYGYQIQMSTRPTYGFRTIRVISGTRVACMGNGLSRAYPYYFRMRAYKKTGGQYVYGAWSKVIKMR